MNVSDHTALTTNMIWAKSGSETIVTYSLNAAIESYWAATESSALLATFTSASAVESVIRAAFRAWEDVADLQIVQVAGDDAMINIGIFEFAVEASVAQFAGYAYFPDTTNSSNSIGGDMFIDNDYAGNLGLLLHEIGHALGLEHPHEGGTILQPNLDNTTNTVMSYNGPLTTVLGYLDVAASQAMYGTQGHANQIVSTYELNRAPTSESMRGIRDFDGNNLGSAGGWKKIGEADVQGDGDDEFVFVNPTIGRWATVGPDSNGMVDFANHSWGGDTRVVGIYIDPLVAQGIVQQGSPHDSQQRFANDLTIDNLRLMGQGDFDQNGSQNVFFKTTDGTAYLNAIMHADGNIQYANYMSEQQLIDFMNTNGVNSSVYSDWLMA